MILLASGSPRRRELLTQIGVPYRVQPADVDETRLPNEPPIVYVRRVALAKAYAARRLAPSAHTVLAADTTVALLDRVFSKPADLAEAAAMLHVLAGRTHHVHTGVAILHGTAEFTHVETTAVTFTPVPESELTRYLASGDSLDKAGGYGIQGYAARWIQHIEGDYSNVVGLPLAATVQLLRTAGAVC